MKGEQLQNFVEHSLPAPTNTNDGPNFSIRFPSWSPPGPVSTGSVISCDALVYYRWALRAWLRQGRMQSMSLSFETESEEASLDDTLPAKSRESERERKQRKLWAYRQRTMGWSNPLKWTRSSFRRRLNEVFVDVLMNYPPNWTSARTGLERTAMESWLCRERSLCEYYADVLD